jgi:hypothetical protein
MAVRTEKRSSRDQQEKDEQSRALRPFSHDSHLATLIPQRRFVPFLYWSGYGKSENVTNPSARFRNRIFGDAINQIHAKRLRRAHFFCSNEHFEGSRLPDQSGQPLRSTPARDES